MKIIADKAPKSGFPFTSECEHCNSIVEIERELDLKQVTVKNPRIGEFLGAPIYWQHEVEGFHCPCCNKDSKLVMEKNIYKRVSLAEAQQNASIERVVKELDEIRRCCENI